MLLTTDKKIATQADANDILAQSYALDRPFGIPTIILDRQEFLKGSPERISNRFIPLPNLGSLPYGDKGKKLSDHFHGVLIEQGRFPPAFAQDAFKICSEIDYTCGHDACIFLEQNFSGYSLVIKTMQNDGKKDYAQNYDPAEYHDPFLNCIIVPGDGGAEQKCLNDFILPGDELPLNKNSVPIPGYDAQWRFLALWHEFAHGTGAAEPQAQMMAAAVYRKTFADSAVLLAEADIRCVTSVLKYEFEEFREQYYAMDEATDIIRAMDQEKIDALTEDDIKAMRFHKFERDDQTLKFVGVTIQWDNPSAFVYCDMPSMASTAEKMITEGVFPANSPEGRLARRFHQAACRLSLGTPAYSAQRFPFLQP